MEKVSWNTVNKKQNGLEQIENEKHKILARARAYYPGVATPQSRKWIIYIIAYAYNPFTAPWGGRRYLLNPINKHIRMLCEVVKYVNQFGTREIYSASCTTSSQK